MSAKTTHYRNALVIILVALILIGAKAYAALYNITGTDEFVNGVPPSLTVKERAKLVTTTVAKTEASCLAGKCKLVGTAAAKAKIKGIIVAETPPPVVTPPVVPPVVVVPPPVVVQPPPVVVVPTGVINYTDGRPSIDTTKIPVASTDSYSDLRIKPTTEQPVPSDVGGAFRILCGYSHMNFDDAIVYPDQQGKAHLHVYFGNANADYRSTSESIMNGGNSTCQGGIMNRSAYWAPAMIDGTTPIKPTHSQIYYKHGVVQPIPRGLRMISGDMRNNVSLYPTEAWKRANWFECNDVYSGHQDNIIPCGQGGFVTMVVTFPNCWDGKNLDSPNHKDHMAFSVNGVCPAIHPKKVPTITMKVYYPVGTNGTTSWRLSSDMYAKNGQNAGYSAHADFMYGWIDEFHKGIVDNCINPAKDAHSHLLCDGRMIY